MTQASGSLDRARGWLFVAVFLFAYVFSFIDRMILSLLVEPLKKDLLLSDTQISLLQGFAFAIFYTLVGLPLGRLIDTFNRIRIAAVGVALWSAMTALSGVAQNYTHLFLARIGVGVGEAALSPAAYSIFADVFDRRRLGLAFGIYNVGSAIGAGIAMIGGGIIVQFAMGQADVTLPLIGTLRPWQLTFVYVGLPGLLMAAAVAALPEPPRQSASSAPSIAEVAGFIRANRVTLTWHHLGVSFSNLSTFAVVSWMPAMLGRAYGWSIAESGLAVGSALLVGGVIGLAGGGWISDRQYAREGTAGRMRVSLVANLLALPIGASLGFQGQPLAAVIVFGLTYTLSVLPITSSATALQEIAPSRMRAQLTALYLFVVNLIGIGLGSTFVGVLSDRVFTAPDGIRYALSVVSASSLAVAVICYWMSIEPMRRSAERAEISGNR